MASRFFQIVLLTISWMWFGPAISYLLFISTTDAHGLPTGYTLISLLSFAAATGLFLIALKSLKSSGDSY